MSFDLDALKQPHARFPGSVLWRLRPAGISVDGAPPEVTKGEPATVRRIWETWRDPLEYHARAFGVPVELLIATAATETRGNPAAVRLEPLYVSDEETPQRVSPGLMQTLISTAREATGNALLDRDYLLRPEGSIEAGAAYIASQAGKTGFDPPLVAAAYNAGGVYFDRTPANRWRLKCWPLGTGEHVDRWVRWFDDVARYFRDAGIAPAGSFAEALSRKSAAT